MSTGSQYPEKHSNRNILQPAPAPQESSPLLKLPGELRNRIYELVFSDRYHVPLTPTNWPKVPGSHVQPTKFSNRNAGHGLALLQTCRAVYKEAHHLPFTRGTLIVGDPTAHDNWDFMDFQYAPCDPRVYLPLHAEQLIANLEVHFTWDMMWQMLVCPEDFWNVENDDTDAVECWLAQPTLKSLKTLHVLLHIYPDSLEPEGSQERSPEANWGFIQESIAKSNSQVWDWAEMVANTARMHDREVGITVDFGADFAPGFLIVWL
ncbi:hypothetical protein PMIN06_002514 [Paraphaeosphaeria minitans]